jgi:hypothetical protein
MRHLARRKQGITGLESQPFLSNLNDKIAFGRIEPLVLIVMQVPRRAAFCVKGIFQNEQPAAILRDDLEVNGTDAEAALFTKSVFACLDPQHGRKIRGRLQNLHHTSLFPSIDDGLNVNLSMAVWRHSCAAAQRPRAPPTGTALSRLPV